MAANIDLQKLCEILAVFRLHERK